MKSLHKGEVRGSNPMGLNTFLYIPNRQSTSDTWHQGIGPRVLTLLTTNDTCHPLIRQPSTNESVPCHPPDMSSYGWYDPATSPYGLYGLYGQVQSTSKNFAYLSWRTDRDISFIRTPFEKVNIPSKSGR
jgi:hypothetical protein